jgi:hypothetical protein
LNSPCKWTNFHVNPKPKSNYALGIFKVNLIIFCLYFSSVVIVFKAFVKDSLIKKTLSNCVHKSFIIHSPQLHPADETVTVTKVEKDNKKWKFISLSVVLLKVTAPVL